MREAKDVETASEAQAQADDVMKQVMAGLRKAGLPASMLRIGDEPYPRCCQINLHTVGYISQMLRTARAPAKAVHALLESAVETMLHKVVDLALLADGDPETMKRLGFQHESLAYLYKPSKETRAMMLALCREITGDDFAEQSLAKHEEFKKRQAASEPQSPAWVAEELARPSAKPSAVHEKAVPAEPAKSFTDVMEAVARDLGNADTDDEAKPFDPFGNTEAADPGVKTPQL